MLPPETPLTFGSITVFVGLLVPRLRDRHARRAATAAAIAAGAGASLPHGIGLVLGIAIGAFLPLLLERRAR
jgi:predicted branched-subunit amino acid permease